MFKIISLPLDSNNWFPKLFPRSAPARSSHTLKLRYQTLYYWHIDQNINQWNILQSPEANPCEYVNLVSENHGILS